MFFESRGNTSEVPNSDAGTLEGWVNVYLQANAGALLPGMVHNHQNAVHSLAMQTELLLTSFNSSKTPKALNRLTSLSRNLIQAYEHLGKRQVFTQKTPTQVNMELFAHWLHDYWTNDLFLKHHVQLEITVSQECPQTLHLCPYHLTLCFEEALKNAVEGCFDKGSQERHKIQLTILPNASGVSVTIASPTRLEQDCDPFAPYSTTKPAHLGLGLALVRHCCASAGWSSALTPHNGQALFRLDIPVA